ncbi:MAG: hypothetical protein KKD21_06280, partial [Proteobacteria bacterium]|nr:hypothetical protein [Pseudomonadota bacterium]
INYHQSISVRKLCNGSTISPYCDLRLTHKSRAARVSTDFLKIYIFNFSQLCQSGTALAVP